jgi:uncharacterized protein YceK
MRLNPWKSVLVIAACMLVSSEAYAQTPTITGISPTSGPVGTLVQITGTNFGATQGSSTASLNGTSATAVTWSSTVLGVLVPAGATSGTFSVTVNGHGANSSSFTVTSLPAGWSDGDVGSVGVAGSASYANGVFTVKGAGSGIYAGATSDGLNLMYQALSGDATIVARVASLTGGSSYESAGLMIRETLNAGATNAYSSFWGYYSEAAFTYRPSSGASTSATTLNGLSLPYWVKLVRSGSTFSAYAAPDGVNWVQVGSSQTIDMAQNVYMGLGVSSQNTSALATATFDNVSISSNSITAPLISNVSATTGPVGSQVVISGLGFGAAGVVTLNGALATINSWSSTSVSITIPTGATSGNLVVSASPSMNDSNPVFFTVTSQALPSGWLDQDVGQVGVAGSATYSNGVFTVKGAGAGTYSGLTNDGIHYVFQPLSGDGTIVARIASVQGGSTYASAGVMIRETLNSGATNAQTFYWPTYSEAAFSYRTSTGANLSVGADIPGVALPYWLKLVRSEGAFSGYASPDGVNWVQIGASQTRRACT